MKTKILILIILMTSVYSCNKQSTTEEPDMYVPSELAMLMRQMEAENLALKKIIEAGGDSLFMPLAYKAMDIAKPTTEGTINDSYKSFSMAYRMAMDELHSSDSSLVYRYNKGVQACINCHNQFCAGPISRIEELFISD